MLIFVEIRNMSNWKYKGKIITSLKDIPKEYQNKDNIQIIYKITTKKKPYCFYIGKKILFFKKKTKLSKKKKLELNTRRVYEYKISESNWLTYYGSSTNKEFINMLNTLNREDFEREILMFVEGKMMASFYEAKYLFSDEGMMHPNCMNNTILNKFFKSKLR